MTKKKRQKREKISEKLTVKVTLSRLNPMDAEIMGVLAAERKKSGVLRLALYSYIKGLNNGPFGSRRQMTEEDRKVKSKISRLENLDF